MTIKPKEVHTPTPWTSKHPSYYSDDAEHILAPMPGQEGLVIASYVLPANAAFIVKAVNSHADLLEACKFTVEKYDCLNSGYAPTEDSEEITLMRKAISKAQGTQEEGRE